MTDAGHTGTPWRLGPPHKNGTIAVHADKASVFHLTPFGSSAKAAEANAAFIVLACNSYAELTAALRYVLGDGPTGIPRASSECRDVVRAALASSEGKP